MNGRPPPEPSQALSEPQQAPTTPLKRLTSEQVSTILELSADGLSHRQIAAETGFSKSAVGRALKSGPSRLAPAEKEARRKAQAVERARRYREKKRRE